MILLKGSREAHTACPASVDTVVTAFDLPKGSQLQGFRCRTDVISTSSSLARESAVGFAVRAALIELDDPDTGDSYNDLWDRYIPKATSADVIDFDTATADTDEFWDPGQASFEEMFNMGNLPMTLFSAKRRLNYASPGNSGLRHVDQATPFDPQWHPGETIMVASRRRIKIRKPTVLLVALSSPSYAVTTNTRVHLTELEWGQIQYIKATAERALVDQLVIDVDESWAVASAVMRKHLAPSVFEETGATFLTSAWNVFTYLEFRHTVPGEMDIRQIDLTP